MKPVWFPVILVLPMCVARGGLSSAVVPSHADNSTEADTSSNADGTKLVCYYTPTSYFPAGEVPANLCTHLVYAFGSISTSPPNIAAPSAGVASIWATLTSLKQKNPQLKVLLSLQNGFPELVGPDVSKMQQFAGNSLAYLRRYQFDGVDMDWEYPKSSQKTAFAAFFKLMRQAIEKEAAATRKPALLLSLALPNNQFVASRSYDLPGIAAAVDFATAMTYDFHLYNKGDTKTGYNSPLFTPPGEYKYFSAAAMAEYYLGQGFPGSKLLLGIPTYGRSWKLANPSSHGLHAPAVSKGDPGPVHHLRGIYLYADACVAIKRGASRVRDPGLGAVYLYKGSNWVAYDDGTTVAAKCNWVRKNGLGGVGVWALHLDDVGDVCNEGSLPLITAMKHSVEYPHLSRKSSNNHRLETPKQESGNRFRLNWEEAKRMLSNQTGNWFQSDQQGGNQIPLNQGNENRIRLSNVKTQEEPSTRDGMTHPELGQRWYDPYDTEINRVDLEKPQNRKSTNIRKVQQRTGVSEPILERRRHVFNDVVVPMESADEEQGKPRATDVDHENHDINSQDSTENALVGMLKSVFQRLVRAFLNHFQSGPKTSAE